MAMHHGVQLPPTSLAGVNENNIFPSLLQVMGDAGLKGKVLRRASWRYLAGLGTAYPVMAVQKSGDWVIVLNVVITPEGTSVALLDPLAETSGMVLVPREEFEKNWDGVLVLCKKKEEIADKGIPFGFAWFIPQIMQQGRFLRDVAIAAIAMNLLGIGAPLLFQVIIDKVITHHSYHTLYVVVLVFLVITVFEAIFGFVRQYLMLLATNRIDARLSSYTYQHLLSLPLQFFEGHTAGVLTRHMQQTEPIRNFLTGRMFQTILDMVFFPITLTILSMISLRLTGVVLAFSLGIAAWLAIMVPIYRRYLDRLYQAEGARQAQLVETIHGMRTVKSLALELFRKRVWDDKTAVAVRRHADVGRIGILGNTFSSALEKIMMIVVLSVGAISVFSGALSLGALVAFNMLSGRVIQPLLQIVALINEYQQAALSVRMLGTVMTHPPERDPSQIGVRHRISGEVVFEAVTFRYHGSSTPAINNVSFKVEEGQMIGVVGRSGSGKSTLTRLMQGINTAQEGSVRLSGTDIRHVDLTHLRRSIGIVLQDNFLFRGTIRENIASAKPDASLEEIMESARMAGAEEFIDRLPASYETLVEENAANFSGGQKQRLAIARALLTRPRLLIFDEATSALDPESEAIIQANLSIIAKNRTMIIVSHRLSSLVQSDLILVIDQGKVMDFAPHSVLVERCDVYRHLWDQQTQHVAR
jgi:ATP-binding cassette subfamily B protein